MSIHDFLRICPAGRFDSFPEFVNYLFYKVWDIFSHYLTKYFLCPLLTLCCFWDFTATCQSFGILLEVSDSLFITWFFLQSSTYIISIIYLCSTLVSLYSVSPFNESSYSANFFKKTWYIFCFYSFYLVVFYILFLCRDVLFSFT